MIVQISSGQGPAECELAVGKLLEALKIEYPDSKWGQTPLQIPLQLKYGVEKSRMVMFLLFGVIALAVVGGQTLFEGKTAPLQNVAALLDSLPSASVLLLLTAVSALIAFISYRFSIRIMEKKEF